MDAGSGTGKPGEGLVFRMTNAGDSEVHIRIEPWGREYDLSAGATREFVFTGPDPAEIEVEAMPGEVTIYGWTGAVLDGIGLPIPGLPPRPE